LYVTGELRQLTVTSQLLTTALLASHQILSSSDWVAYDDITEELGASHGVLTHGVDKDAIEASLQANIDGQINPTQASGVPW
jgi:hypothetical protein